MTADRLCAWCKAPLPDGAPTKMINCSRRCTLARSRAGEGRKLAPPGGRMLDPQFRKDRAAKAGQARMRVAALLEQLGHAIEQQGVTKSESDRLTELARLAGTLRA